MSKLTGESLKIIMIIILGWSCFAFADTTAKYLSSEHAPKLILSFSGLFSGALLVIYILIDRGWRGFLSPNWKWLIARAACIAFTATGVVNAVSYIDLADLYGITFCAPFISVILAASLLKEEVGWHRWLAVIIGFIGVLVILGPSYSHMNMGIVSALIAALSIGLGTIVIRKIGNKEYMPLFILYPYAGILIVNLPLAWPTLEIPATPDLWGFIANAVFVMGGQLFVTYAIANAKSTASISPFVYIQVLWGTLFGYFLFGNVISATTALGLVLVIGAGLFMIYREQQLNRKNKRIITR
jgi:drug/metabolite transporter (DMT)-like permease